MIHLDNYIKILILYKQLGIPLQQYFELFFKDYGFP